MSNSEFQKVIVRPVDEYNQRLVAYLHPPDWVNPKPSDCYDLVVSNLAPGNMDVKTTTTCKVGKVFNIE